MSFTFDKLPGVRAVLVRLDDNRQEWDFTKLVESLRRWTDQKHKKQGVFQTTEQKQTLRAVFPVTKTVIKLVSVSQ